MKKQGNGRGAEIFMIRFECVYEINGKKRINPSWDSV